MFGDTPFTYLYSMTSIHFAETPTPEQIREFDLEDTDNEHGYVLDLGIDFGTNHATTLKASH